MGSANDPSAREDPVASLEIARGLSESLGTPKSLRDLSISLDNVAEVERARGDLGTALAKYEESLAITRGLAESLRTPESLHDVCVRLV